MRTRLLASVAALAATLLLPSAALALNPPVLSAPSATHDPPALSWPSVAGASLGFVIYRANGDCAGSPSLSQIGFDPSPSATAFTDTPAPAEGTHCYRVDSDDGIQQQSNLVTVTYDVSTPSGSLVSPGTAVHGTAALTAAASDGLSGVDKVEFQSSLAGANSWSTFS
ncbi:MAG: hypothetical protein QOD65_3394, partial [Gaiellales bacterium]|nr:hypothetical protein [Gaiellales bacterium]